MQFKAKEIIRGHIMLWAEQMIEWFAKKEDTAFCYPPQFL